MTSNPQIDRLLATLHARSRPLGDLADAPISTGVQTPLDAAFIVDKATRDRMAIFDPSCARLLRRLLRADDLRPWHHAAASAYCITLPPGWTVATFGAGLSAADAWQRLAQQHPALARHLAPWAAAARAVSHSPFWWELPPQPVLAARDSPKIVWPLQSDWPRVARVDAGTLVDGACCCVSLDAPPLLGMLGSRSLWFAATQHGDSRAPAAVAQLPMPAAPDEAFDALGGLAAQISAAASARHALHEATRRRILADFGPPGRHLSEPLLVWWLLDFPNLLAEINRALGNDIPFRRRDAWQAWFAQQRAAHDEYTAAIAQHEAALNEQVYALFGLADEEIALIEATVGYAYGEV